MGATGRERPPRAPRVGHLGRARGIALAAALAVSAPSVAEPKDEPAPLSVRLGLAQGRVTASFDVTSAFTESFRRKLTGGLTSRVLIEMELFDPLGESLDKTVRVCQLRLDVWEDVLFVSVTDEDFARRRTFVLTDEALRACGVVENIALAPWVTMSGGGDYRLFVRVALNPVSPEILDRTREFMANPRGTSGGRPRAFFGAVAKLFGGDGDADDERFVFRSGPLARPVREK